MSLFRAKILSAAVHSQRRILEAIKSGLFIHFTFVHIKTKWHLKKKLIRTIDARIRSFYWSRNGLTKSIDQQLKQSSSALTFPYVQSTSKQYSGDSSSSSSSPPPRTNNNQAIWTGVAAMLLGGGAYFVYNSQTKTSEQQNTSKQPAEKREPKHFFAQYHVFHISKSYKTKVRLYADISEHPFFSI